MLPEYEKNCLVSYIIESKGYIDLINLDSTDKMLFSDC